MVKEPLLLVCLPSDEVVKQIVQRAVLVKSISELIGVANNIESLANTQNNELMAI